MKIKNLLLLISAVVACGFWSTVAYAQSSSVFAGGLKAPSKIVMTAKGNLLVAESGDGPNAGRLSLIDRQTHARRTILDGLPAGPSADGGMSGPSGLALRGRTIYLLIGGGDATQAGPAPASEKVNPNPSSPIFSSLLALQVPANVEEMTSGFTLSAADHASLKGGSKLALSNSGGDKLTIELVTDFPDYEAAPRPDFTDNVRVSNPFGVAVNGNLLYVVDASLNKVSTVGAESGSVSTLSTFAQYNNPLPFGPPKIDAVPDSVRLFGDRLLIPTLTGFPFPTGVAEVRQVDLVTGAQGSLIQNLTTAIDLFPVRIPPRENNNEPPLASVTQQVTQNVDPTHYFVLSFSTDMLQNAPGRLLMFDGSAPVTLASPLISPTSLARDPKNGDIFITSIFTGLVVRVSFARELVRAHYKDFLGREPDQQGWDFWAGEIEKCGTDAACNDRKSVDVSRAFFYSAEFIGHHPELNEQLRGSASYNREFVRQSYSAYLRRTCDPEVCDTGGFNFWVNKLNSRLPSVDADYNDMIHAFLVSAEYRARFGLQ
ncbi:MAG: hypothetical protein QOC61_2364 [Acidobacteriota bacterium]|jgi:hypothetical protein|nr:hypothetical protein [Acidobacteriota bacterium]